MTVVAWIFVGILVGMIARALMTVPHDGGKLPSVIVGVCSACIGGGLAVAFAGGGLIGFNPFSISLAVIASLYTLFAYRCFASRAHGQEKGP